MSRVTALSSSEATFWDDSLRELGSPVPLLQTYGWGEAHRRHSQQVKRLWLPGGAMAQVFLYQVGTLCWGEVPKGPLPATMESIDDLVAWARDVRLAQLRVDPPGGPDLRAGLYIRGFREHWGPDALTTNTVLVGLGEPEVMLGSFKAKTRYNIALAQRRGVTVKEGREVAELERQVAASAQRQGFISPRRSYYESLIASLDWCRTYIARHHDEALAGILVARHDGRAYYLFGGHTRQHAELMPNYAVHWEAMTRAAAAGIRDYDFWGIPPELGQSHPLHGLWQFKTGFNGRVAETTGSWDLVLSALEARLLHSAHGLRLAVRQLRSVGHYYVRRP